MSTTIYANSFDGEALGTLPAGWTNLVGSWNVTGSNTPDGRGLASITAGNLDAVAYAGATLPAQSEFSYAYLDLSSTRQNILSPVIRAQANKTDWYLFNWDLGGNVTFFRHSASGGYAVLASTSSAPTVASSFRDIIAVDVTINGSTFELRLWNVTKGQTRPSAATFSATDSALSGGNAGFACLISGGDTYNPTGGRFVITDNTGSGTPTPPAPPPPPPPPPPSGLVIDRLNAAVTPAPFAWKDDGTSLNANSTGSYFTLGFTGTSIALNTVALTNANSAPVVRAFIDNLPHVDVPLTSGATSFTLATGLAAGSHTLKLALVSHDALDNYWSLACALKVTGFTVDVGASASPVAKRSKTALWFGDSLTEGYKVMPDGSMDGTATVVWPLMEMLDAEFGQIGYGGQGYLVAGDNLYVPALSTAYSQYSGPGGSRLVGGVLSPAPDYLMCMHGTNPVSGTGVPAQSDIASQIAAFRTIAPTATIFMIVPPGGYARAAITAATNAAIAAGDTNLRLIDAGPGFSAGLNQPGVASEQASDGIHLYNRTNVRFAARLAKLIQHALEPRRFTITVTAS